MLRVENKSTGISMVKLRLQVRDRNILFIVELFREVHGAIFIA